MIEESLSHNIGNFYAFKLNTTLDLYKELSYEDLARYAHCAGIVFTLPWGPFQIGVVEGTRLVSGSNGYLLTVRNHSGSEM